MKDAKQQARIPQQPRHALSILNEIARALNASVDLPTLLRRALEKVVELLGLHTGWVLLFDEATGEPHLAAAQNLPPGLHREPQRMAGWCYCLQSFCEGHLDAAANVSVVTCSRLHKTALAQGDTAGLCYHASIPLAVYVGEAPLDAGQVDASDHDASFKRLGMLNVASSEWRQLGDDELDLLRTIGDVLGVAVERARLHARRLEAAQTEERNRLAREIHDTIAQEFSAIAFQLEAAEALLEQQADVERIRQRLSAALDLAHQGLDTTRRSVLDLRAAPLEGRSLSEALALLAEETDALDGPTVTFSSATATRSLLPAVEASLYRIAQEALQNARRHAAAAHVTLHLGVTPDDVQLTIEDDGRGFDVSTATAARGRSRFGLIGMRERTRLLGGVFHVESTPGVGTRITATVPLSRPAYP